MRTELVLDATAAAWTPVASRHALGDRWLIRLDDGRTAFAKRAIGEATALRGLLAAAVASRLHRGGAPHPRRDSRYRPPTASPDSPTSLPGAGGTSQAIHGPSSGSACAPPTGSTKRCPHSFRRPIRGLLDGEALLHLDARSDNLCLRDGQPILADWNWGPDELARGYPGAAALAPIVAGFLAATAGLPPPAGAPTVRSFQLAQLEVALPWAVSVLGLPELRPAARP